LTDKDALLLLSLATRTKPWLVFAAGSISFTLTSAIIVTVGYFLVSFIPVSLITITGGSIMLAFGIWSFFKGKKEEEELLKTEKRFTHDASKSLLAVFLSAVSILVLLDLAGDSTEVLTILFVAHFQNTLLVFTGAVIALVGATAVETLIGNRLSRILSPKRIRTFSLFVFLIIGIAAILTGIFHL
jgi:putative Ca2+/H+ antiporter (TMEM165/GDT1 family)